MRIAAAVLCAGGVLVLAACGGEAKASAATIDKAASATSAKGTEHFQLSGYVVAAGHRVALSGMGDFKNTPAPGAGSFTMSIQAGATPVQVKAVLDGPTMYLSSPLLATLLPKGKTWASIDLRKAASVEGIDLNQISESNPSNVLALIEKTGSVTKVGTGSVDGVKATHYRATIDLSKVPGGAKLEQLTGTTSEPYDVWIGPNDMVVRVTENTKIDGVTSSTTIDLSRFGEPVVVQVPSSADTFDITKLATKGTP
jgi:hypothetical protein